MLRAQAGKRVVCGAALAALGLFQALNHGCLYAREFGIMLGDLAPSLILPDDLFDIGLNGHALSLGSFAQPFFDIR
jgi:hypothetical protein